LKTAYYFHASIKHDVYPVGPIVYIEDFTEQESKEFTDKLRAAVREDLDGRVAFQGATEAGVNEAYKLLKIVAVECGVARPKSYKEIEKLAVKMRKKLEKEGTL
jgi:hypothetical protein